MKKITRVQKCLLHLAIVIACLMLGTAHADEAYFNPHMNNFPDALRHPYVFMYGGVALFNTPANTQTITLTPGVDNRYSNPDFRHSQLQLGIGAGLLMRASDQFLIQVGASLFHIFNTTVNQGLVEPLINIMPGFDTLDYRYDINYIPVFAELTIMSEHDWFGLHFRPYAVVGAGVSINEFKGYTEVATDPNSSATASPNSLFQNESLTQSAYELGAGFWFSINQHTKVTVDYRYMHLGDTRPATAAAQTTQTRLAVGNVDVHTFGLILLYIY